MIVWRIGKCEVASLSAQALSVCACRSRSCILRLIVSRSINLSGKSKMGHQAAMLVLIPGGASNNDLFWKAMVGSTGERNGPRQCSSRGAVFQGLAGSAVELQCDQVEVVLAMLLRDRSSWADTALRACWCSRRWRVARDSWGRRSRPPPRLRR